MLTESVAVKGIMKFMLVFENSEIFGLKIFHGEDFRNK